MPTALHLLTHVGLSWLVASVGRASRKDRWLVTLSSSGQLTNVDTAVIGGARAFIRF